MLGAADPDLLPIDDVAVTLAPRERGDPGRVGTRGRFGHPERLETQLAAGDGGQVFRLLLDAAVLEQRAHDVHLRMAGATVAAGAVDLLQDRDGGAESEPGPAIFLRDQDGQEACLRQRLHELGRIGAGAILLLPIGAGEVSAQAPHGLADVGMRVDGHEASRIIVRQEASPMARASGIASPA